MTDIAIRIENLSKMYRIGRAKQRHDTLRDLMVDTLRAPFRGRDGNPEEDTIWALKDVSFEVKRGEVVGIIGRNGAGKSTLLKILTRIVEPTGGSFDLYGRVGSLLEVGTGFHPELTGRENVYLNGAILGMKKAQIDRRFNEIVDFSGVEKFLDTPVKRYSSGMQVRLAFSVAAHLEPEILLIDEVLAVGDAEFQKKCLGKMGDVAKDGRTVLFVSHNMGAVNRLCDRAIMLQAGRIGGDGPPREMTSQYYVSLQEPSESLSIELHGTLSSSLEFTKVTINGINCTDNVIVSPSAPIVISVFGQTAETIPFFRVGFAVFGEGVRLFTLHDVDAPETLPNGPFQSQFEIPAYLLRPGLYTIGVGGYRDGASEWAWSGEVAQFRVNEEWSERCDFAEVGLINLPSRGNRKLTWQIKKPRVQNGDRE